MDLLTLIIIFFVGYYVGGQMFLRKIRREVNETAERLGIDLSEVDEDDDPALPSLFTEIENNIILLYNRKTNTFICQANSIEEVAAKSKIKNAVVEHENKLIWFIDGKVKIVTE